MHRLQLLHTDKLPLQIFRVHAGDAEDRAGQSKNQGGSRQDLAGSRAGEFPSCFCSHTDHLTIKTFCKLTRTAQNLSTRQFLLTNTKTSLGTDSHLTFRIPLSLLSASIPSIGNFPYTAPPPITPKSPQWCGPTLFIKGERSRYLNPRNIPVARAFFPSMKLKILDTGHWVHAEEPVQTVDLVEAFIKDLGHS